MGGFGLIAALVVSAIIGLVGNVVGIAENHKAMQEANKTNTENVESTNETNLEIAQENNEFNAEQARINREWQTEMANTAHQREMADLEAAGLNPILTATGGNGAMIGASSVAQANSARMQAPQVMPETFSGINSAVTSITNMMQSIATIKMMDARLGAYKDLNSHRNAYYDARVDKLLDSNLKASIDKTSKPFMNNAKLAGQIEEEISDKDWEALLRKIM